MAAATPSRATSCGTDDDQNAAASSHRFCTFLRLLGTSSFTLFGALLDAIPLDDRPVVARAMAAATAHDVSLTASLLGMCLGWELVRCDDRSQINTFLRGPTTAAALLLDVTRNHVHPIVHRTERVKALLMRMAIATRPDTQSAMPIESANQTTTTTTTHSFALALLQSSLGASPQGTSTALSFGNTSPALLDADVAALCDALRLEVAWPSYLRCSLHAVYIVARERFAEKCESTSDEHRSLEAAEKAVDFLAVMIALHILSPAMLSFPFPEDIEEPPTSTVTPSSTTSGGDATSSCEIQQCQRDEINRLWQRRCIETARALQRLSTSFTVVTAGSESAATPAAFRRLVHCILSDASPELATPQQLDDANAGGSAPDVSPARQQHHQTTPITPLAGKATPFSSSPMKDTASNPPFRDAWEAIDRSMGRVLQLTTQPPSLLMPRIPHVNDYWIRNWSQYWQRRLETLRATSAAPPTAAATTRVPSTKVAPPPSTSGSWFTKWFTVLGTAPVPPQESSSLPQAAADDVGSPSTRFRHPDGTPIMKPRHVVLLEEGLAALAGSGDSMPGHYAAVHQVSVNTVIVLGEVLRRQQVVMARRQRGRRDPAASGLTPIGSASSLQAASPVATRQTTRPRANTHQAGDNESQASWDAPSSAASGAGGLSRVPTQDAVDDLHFQPISHTDDGPARVSPPQHSSKLGGGGNVDLHRRLSHHDGESTYDDREIAAHFAARFDAFTLSREKATFPVATGHPGSLRVLFLCSQHAASASVSARSWGPGWFVHLLTDVLPRYMTADIQELVVVGAPRASALSARWRAGGSGLAVRFVDRIDEALPDINASSRSTGGTVPLAAALQLPGHEAMTRHTMPKPTNGPASSTTGGISQVLPAARELAVALHMLELTGASILHGVGDGGFASIPGSSMRVPIVSDGTVDSWDIVVDRPEATLPSKPAAAAAAPAASAALQLIRDWWCAAPAMAPLDRTSMVYLASCFLEPYDLLAMLAVRRAVAQRHPSDPSIVPSRLTQRLARLFVRRLGASSDSMRLALPAPDDVPEPNRSVDLRRQGDTAGAVTLLKVAYVTRGCAPCAVGSHPGSLRRSLPPQPAWRAQLTDLFDEALLGGDVGGIVLSRRRIIFGVCRHYARRAMRLGLTKIFSGGIDGAAGLSPSPHDGPRRLVAGLIEDLFGAICDGEASSSSHAAVVIVPPPWLAGTITAPEAVALAADLPEEDGRPQANAGSGVLPNASGCGGLMLVDDDGSMDHPSPHGTGVNKLADLSDETLHLRHREFVVAIMEEVLRIGGLPLSGTSSVLSSQPVSWITPALL